MYIYIYIYYCYFEYYIILLLLLSLLYIPMVIGVIIFTMSFFTVHMIYLLYYMIRHYFVSGLCVSSMDFFFPNSPATSKDPLVVLCGGGLCTTTVPGNGVYIPPIKLVMTGGW